MNTATGGPKCTPLNRLVMLGECSNLPRAWHDELIRNYGALDRVHTVRGAGHLLWNGLDGHDQEVRSALLAFWDR